MTVSMLTNYRLATAEDAREIGAFQIRAWRENYGEFLPGWVVDGFSVEERIAAWRQILRRPSFHDNAFVVLSADERGIATLGASCAQRAGKLKALGFTAQLEALYVRGDLQHHGLGRRLLSRVFAELGARGHRSASHWLMRKNRHGADFLEATGAQPISLNGTAKDPTGDVAYGWRDIGRPDVLSWHDPRGRLGAVANRSGRLAGEVGGTSTERSDQMH